MTAAIRITVPATVPAATAARRTGNSLGRRIQQAAYRITSGGTSSTAENLVISASPIAAAAKSNRRGLASSRYSTQSTQAKWRHSIATAVIAKELAPIYGVAAGVAHTAGILHDVGRMGLLSAYRDSYTEVVLHAYDNVADILAKERAVCRIDHCEAGLYLAKSWGFPAAFCQVVQHHHGSSEERGILSLVQTACALADDLEFAAVSHADRAEPNTRITGCKGNSDRDKVLSRLREIERLVFDELESLDF